MKAIVILEPGGPEVLQIREREIPVPEPGHVLIRVKAAGINRPDIAQRKGHYPPPPGASKDIPGLEVAGVIDAVGKNCVRWKKGDSVCALLTGGGYAEFCVAPEGQCLPVPGSLSFVEAASLPETYFTVWSNVMDRGKLQPGESILVHGGAGGIGVAAIQLSKTWGATVYVTCGTDEKCMRCRELGATDAINYNTSGFKDAIRRLTGSHGVDVVLDMIGGDYTNDNLSVLAEDGRLVIINFMKGEESAIKLGHILTKRLTITGSTLRPRDASFKSGIAARLEEHVWPWLANGSVKPVINKTFPLAQAAEAHRFMESNAHFGKIMLQVQ